MILKNTFTIIGTAALAVGLAACGGDDVDNNTTNNNTTNNNTTNNNTANNNSTNNTGFQQPADTTPLSFCIDDTANKTYAAGDGLVWKGSFTYDETTRILTHDPGWGGGNGPYPGVYDDGPWNMGGHEPAGATAGDNIWCVTAFVSTPSEDLAFEYGAENAAGWIWTGSNGSFTLTAGSTDEIIADPLVIAAHGTIDMRLTVDTTTLAADWDFDPTMHDVKVKGSYAAWQEIACMDDASAGDEAADDGVYTFVLSSNVGAGTDLKHAGLLKAGDQAQFVFVIRGVEYKGEITGLTGTVPLTQGVKAEISTDGGTTWSDAPIMRQPDGDQNTYVSP